MGLLHDIKTAFTHRNDAAATPSASPAGPKVNPLNLHLGSMVQFKNLPVIRAVGDALQTEVPEGYQRVVAIGSIDLGDDVFLTRYYLAHGFIQVQSANGDFQEAQLFSFHSDINPSDRAHFDAYLNPESPGKHLGTPTLTVGAFTYTRVFVDDQPDVDVPPLCLDETLYKDSGTKARVLYPMLYAREVEALDNNELALISGEEAGENDYRIRIAVGINLNRADLDLT